MKKEFQKTLAMNWVNVIYYKSRFWSGARNGEFIAL